jgi:hypothetical protein
MTAAVICPGCGATVSDVEQTRRRTYVGSAPGCWLLYSEVLAREYGDFRYTPAHQLTVDAYAVQHPASASDDRRSRSPFTWSGCA